MALDGQETHKNQGIQVISRAADILRLLSEETDGLSLGQIARRVNLPRSTVQRIVAALTIEGFISSDKGYGGIRLGPGLLNLTRASASDMREKLRQVMKDIADRTGETVDLAILDHGAMLFVDQVVGSHRLRTVSNIGERFPLTTTANGKAALACLDPEEAKTLIDQELAAQGSTSSGAKEIEKLGPIRASGVAEDANEHTDGISALGIAIKTSGGGVYAISTPVPSHRFSQIRDQLAAELKAARVKLSS